MSLIPPYPDALRALRDVLAFYAARPSVLPHLLELEDKGHGAARAALNARVPLPALSAELGRLAAETIPPDPAGATPAGRAMARWAAREYYGALGLYVGEAGP